MGEQPYFSSSVSIYRFACKYLATIMSLLAIVVWCPAVTLSHFALVSRSASSSSSAMSLRNLLVCLLKVVRDLPEANLEAFHVFLTLGYHNRKTLIGAKKRVVGRCAWSVLARGLMSCISGRLPTHAAHLGATRKSLAAVVHHRAVVVDARHNRVGAHHARRTGKREGVLVVERRAVHLQHTGRWSMARGHITQQREL